MSAPIADILVETDARGRTNLSKFSRQGRFLGRQEADGTIILEPAVIVTATAERLHRNPETLAAAEAASAAIEEAEPLELAESK